MSKIARLNKKSYLVGLGKAASEVFYFVLAATNQISKEKIKTVKMTIMKIVARA